jgi:hypothetical protein
MATLAVTEIDSDNCSVGSLSLSKTSFNFSNLGANTVSLSVTDGSGNNSTCTATVTVTDVTAPQALCKAATMILDAGGNGILTIAAVNKNSADAGDSIAKLSLSKTSYNCANLGANVVTLTVTDQGGNTATCQSTVTVAGPQLTIEVTPTDCGDYNGSITMTVTGGNGQPGYSIDGGQNYKLINTYTGLTGGLYSAVVTFFGGTGCTLPAVPVVISSGAPDTNTWTGAGDGVNWSDKANWSTGFVPLSCHNVIIPPGHNVVVPNGVIALGRTLFVDMGSTVTLEQNATMDILPY